MSTRLLDALLERANARGLVIVRAQVLQDETHTTREELCRELDALERDEGLRILSPVLYLVVALPRRMWPSRHGVHLKSGPNRGPEPSRGYSYSFHKHESNQSKAIALEDGGVGEGGELLAEILSTLGESDPAPFRGVLEHFSADKVRAALARVRATPEAKLRKSRTALFRYLLARS
jgi:hypothetical protein